MTPDLGHTNFPKWCHAQYGETHLLPSPAETDWQTNIWTDNIGYLKKTLSADQYELDAVNLNYITAVWILTWKFKGAILVMFMFLLLLFSILINKLYLVKSKCLCHSESPSLLKTSPDHSCAGRRRSRGQAKWVWKLNSTDLNADIYLIYGTEEQWQLRNGIHRLSIQRLKKTNVS